MTRPKLEHIADGLRKLAVPLVPLVLDPNNARTHDERNIDAIKRSLAKFGQRKPIVVRKDGNTVIAGNGTVVAARELGWKHIAAVVTNDTDAEAAAYAIADNRTAELAEWDLGELSGLLDELKGEFDLPELGFTSAELQTMLDDVAGGPSEVEEPTTPEPPADPITQPGDLWRLGDHRLYCGDSFKKDDAQLLLEGKPADLIATDPPYAIYGSSTGIGADIADDKMVRPFFEQLGRTCMRSVIQFGHVYAFCDWRSYPALSDGFKRAKLSPKNCLVWDKGGGLGANYANCHEFIAYFARLPPPKSMSEIETGQRGVLRPNILRHNRVTGDERQHNAAKPVALMAELITNSSDEGGIVLDLFGGSGSTLIACENLNRRARLMEIEPAYCDVIIQRWESLTGGKATR